MEDLDKKAFIAGFLEGVRHYSWWSDKPDGTKHETVGWRYVPIDEALYNAEKEALYYYEEYQKGQK